MDISISTVFGIFPVIIWYTEKFRKNNTKASTRMFFVLISPIFKFDNSIIVHELTHVRQWYATLGFHSLLYWLSKKYRYWSEFNAYLNMFKNSEIDRDRSRYIELFSYQLANNYNIDVPIGTIRGQFRSKLGE